MGANDQPQHKVRPDLVELLPSAHEPVVLTWYQLAEILDTVRENSKQY